jgi:flagellin
MGLRINSNESSVFAKRQTDRAVKSILSANEKLSSGLRINRAADDAAGLAIAERFSSQVRQLNQESQNFQSGSNLLETAEGGLDSQGEAVQRIRELATQSANGTLNDQQRQAINEESQQLLEHIDQTAQQTTFNGASPLDSGNQEFTLDGSGDVAVATSESTVDSLGLSGVDLSTQAGAQAALDSLDNAQAEINTNRANLGAQQNALRSSINQRENNAIDLQEAESRIRDADIGRVVIEQTRNELLLQAGASAVLRGNLNSKTALSLLGG